MNEREKLKDYIQHKKPSNLNLLHSYANSAILLVVSSEFATLTGMFGKQMLPWYIAAGTVYIAGRIADKISTIETFNIVQKVELAGIPTSIVEFNPHLSARPTEKELFGLRKTSVDVFGLINTIIFPPYSILSGTASLLAAINNRQLASSLKNKLNESIGS